MRKRAGERYGMKDKEREREIGSREKIDFTTIKR